MEEDNDSEPNTDDEEEPHTDDVEEPEEEEVTAPDDLSKAFQMLVLLNPMSTSLTTTCVIVMMILQLIPEKRQMIPTIVSCMHPNFN